MLNVQNPALECVFKCSKFNVSVPRLSSPASGRGSRRGNVELLNGAKHER
jgi:hypothetical protein